MNKIMKLEDVCTQIVDCPHSTPVWLDQGVRVIRNFNLKNGTLDFTDSYYVDVETYEDRIKRIVPEANDIIFSREAPIGNVAIIPEGLKCCLGQRLVLLRANTQIVNPYYLLYCLMSQSVKYQIEQVNKSGSTVSNFNISDLKKLLLPIVELDHQNEIVNCLSTIDKKIEINNKMNVELESMIKTIYNYWFIQFEFPNDEGKPYKSNGGKTVWNDEIKREIPLGWKAISIGEVIKENEKSQIKVGDARKRHGKTPFFTSGSEIIDFNEPFVDGRNIFLNTGGNADVKFFVGKAAYSTDTWCINFGIYTDYVFVYLKSIKETLNNSFFMGSGLKHLQKGQLKEHKICLPTYEIIDKFNSSFQDALTRISINYLQNQELLSLRNFLLELLMNGQVTFKK